MAKENGAKRLFYAADKQIAVYPSAVYPAPVVYLNSFADNGAQINQALRSARCPDFSLVVISNLNWDQDMSPWAIGPIAPNDTPCSGGADAYLNVLLTEIIPEAEDALAGDILWRGLAGYSLAGLFAIYALYQTTRFARVASMSGSLWFPGFREYVLTHEMKSRPEGVYFSLGDKESQTENPYLQSVQKNTEDIEAYYRQLGLTTVFRQHPGNHTQDVMKRMTDGLVWLVRC